MTQGSEVQTSKMTNGELGNEGHYILSSFHTRSILHLSSSATKMEKVLRPLFTSC